MSLCRYLPTPSDRMGILWTLLSIDDTVIIEFGPTGTTHFSMGFFGKIGVEQENRLFATHMSEDDVIMGYTETLEEAIIEVDKWISPKAIFIVASSVSAIIGTDLKGVCRAISPKVSAKLYALENGGFRGDYTTGIKIAYDTLFKNMLGEKTEKLDNTYNILGASLYSYRMRSDINEIKELMKNSFNYDVIGTLCVDTSEEVIRNTVKAKLNIVISFEALELAKYMKEVYDIPYIYGAPYGYTGTLEWLKQISQTIDVSIDNKVTQELMKRIMNIKHYPMYKRMLKNSKPTMSIYSEYDRLLGFRKISEEIGFNIDSFICNHSIKDIDDKDITTLNSERERIELFKNKNNQLIIADDVTLRMANDTNVKLRASMPIVYGSQVANHIPLIGIKGMDYFLEYVDQYLQTLS